MNEATFTFRVDETLKKAFTTAAKARDRNGAQLLRDFMRGFISRQEQEAIEHDAWFRREMATALAEADDPATKWVSNEQVRRDSAKWRQRMLAGESKR